LNYSGFVFKKVIRTGIEPVTHSLEGCCSIQLSYRTESLFIAFLAAQIYKNLPTAQQSIEYFL
jgi:hypothetical protein